MRNGDASVVSSLFGAPGQVEVERGLAEFRGGRPVRITTRGQSIVALPVDGLDADLRSRRDAVSGHHPVPFRKIEKAVAGAYSGEHGIPREWRERLALGDLIAAMAERLFHAGWRDPASTP